MSSELKLSTGLPATTCNGHMNPSVTFRPSNFYTSEAMPTHPLTKQNVAWATLPPLPPGEGWEEGIESVA
jgi:hypothetical protein